MADRICTFSKSIIQHGKKSDRIYLMKLHPLEREDFPQALDALAKEKGYGKIFAKVPASRERLFEANGFKKEATVTSYYANGEDSAFMAKFLDTVRRKDPQHPFLEEVLKWALAKEKNTKVPDLPDLDPSLHLRSCTKEDAQAMARLYHQTFASYPFPIQDPDYIRETMEQDVLYYGIFKGDLPVALSSIEANFNEKNGELTDFATSPDFRGQALASHLLSHMEREMVKMDLKTAYTIARAGSKGINAIFAKGGYIYGGRLTNNTQIGGTLESMNVWHKKMRQSY